MSERVRKHWGWGFEDQQPSPAQALASARALGERLGFSLARPERPVALEAVALRAPRVSAPAALEGIVRTDKRVRASHALGKSYADVVNGFRGRFEHPPDLVAYPRDERELEQVLEWCVGERVAAIPYGGGTSVVGGVTPILAGGYAGSVSIDLARLDRVLEVDATSRSARIQAGATGPALEEQLARHGMTLRHFPQSFEYSTLGGWIATRAGGHFAMLWTHIEDLLESARAITPAGTWCSRRLPASGAGVSPDRMLAGSEGTLGVITEAWMRVRPRPVHRRSAAVRFESFLAGAECVRAIAQSGLHPANCRLLDSGESSLSGAGDGSRALLVLGFESHEHDVEWQLGRALELCAEHGGASERAESGGEANRSVPAAGAADAVGSWREAFLAAPYVRDLLVALGVIAETFETAITWERLRAFHERVSAVTAEAVREACGSPGHVFCRLTHVYADGAAPYFTVLAPGRRGEELEQWAAIKSAASEAILAAGGTITHHHAVGRDHREWYDRQRPAPFAAALRGAKAAVDPAGVMNPGVLVDPL